MNDLIELINRFENGDLAPEEHIRFAALLLYTGLVYSTGTYGRFVNDMIEAGHVNEIAADLEVLRADPLVVLGVDS